MRHTLVRKLGLALLAVGGCVSAASPDSPRRVGDPPGMDEPPDAGGHARSEVPFEPASEVDSGPSPDEPGPPVDAASDHGETSRDAKDGGGPIVADARADSLPRDSGTPIGGNLLANPNFANGWKSGWGSDTIDLSKTGFSTDLPHPDPDPRARSAHFTEPNGGIAQGVGGNPGQPHALKGSCCTHPGATYVFSAWVKSTGHVALKAYLTKTHDGEPQKGLTIPDTGGQWKQALFYFKPVYDYVQLNVWLTAGEMYVAELSLREVATAP